MKTRIHVNQHRIRANRKREAGTDAEPVITVKDYKRNRYGFTAEIVDESGAVVARVCYRPLKPLPCGAVVWVETNCAVRVDGDDCAGFFEDSGNESVAPKVVQAR